MTPNSSNTNNNKNPITPVAVSIFLYNKKIEIIIFF